VAVPGIAVGVGTFNGAGGASGADGTEARFVIYTALMSKIGKLVTAAKADTFGFVVTAFAVCLGSVLAFIIIAAAISFLVHGGSAANCWTIGCN
jgi:hypothetical protein